MTCLFMGEIGVITCLYTNLLLTSGGRLKHVLFVPLYLGMIWDDVPIFTNLFEMG